MEHVRVVPVRVRTFSEPLGVDVSRVVGWRAQSGDTWRGPTRKARPDAVADMAARRAERVVVCSDSTVPDAGGSANLHSPRSPCTVESSPDAVADMAQWRAEMRCTSN